ncbi:MAG: hypothetical protein IPI67_14130 [Myxococcales bacterium]|nr:hypothetical protein [Myxococcales bacterium]
MKTETEYVVDDGKGWPEGVAAGGGPSVSKDMIFYTVRTWWGSLRIVRSLTTGEAKIVSSSDGSAGTITTSFAHPFAYWEFGPPDAIYRFDLRDGSLKWLPGGGCIIIEGASNGLATCAGEGFVDLIDFDKGTTIKLGSSKFEDIAGRFRRMARDRSLDRYARSGPKWSGYDVSRPQRWRGLHKRPRVGERHACHVGLSNEPHH